MLNLILLKTNCKLLGFNFISWYYIYYSLGSVMRKNNDWLMQHIKSIGIVAVICYIVGAAFWNIQEPPTFYRWINLGSVFVYVYKLIVAVAGILAAFYVFSQFVNRQPGKFVSYVAGLTLGIYAVHQPIVKYVIGWLPTMNLWLLIPLVFICTVAITMAIIRLLQTNKWTSLLLLGIRIK